MVTNKMSAWAMSFFTLASLCGSLAYSEAEWMENASCGTKRCKLSRAFMAALFKWVSMVRMTTLMELALAVLAVMRGALLESWLKSPLCQSMLTLQSVYENI